MKRDSYQQWIAPACLGALALAAALLVVALTAVGVVRSEGLLAADNSLLRYYPTLLVAAKVWLAAAVVLSAVGIALLVARGMLGQAGLLAGAAVVAPAYLWVPYPLVVSAVLAACGLGLLLACLQGSADAVNGVRRYGARVSFVLLAATMAVFVPGIAAHLLVAKGVAVASEMAYGGTFVKYLPWILPVADNFLLACAAVNLFLALMLARTGKRRQGVYLALAGVWTLLYLVYAIPLVASVGVVIWYLAFFVQRILDDPDHSRSIDACSGLMQSFPLRRLLPAAAPMMVLVIVSSVVVFVCEAVGCLLPLLGWLIPSRTYFQFLAYGSVSVAIFFLAPLLVVAGAAMAAVALLYTAGRKAHWPKVRMLMPVVVMVLFQTFFMVLFVGLLFWTMDQEITKLGMRPHGWSLGLLFFFVTLFPMMANFLLFLKDESPAQHFNFLEKLIGSCLLAPVHPLLRFERVRALLKRAAWRKAVVAVLTLGAIAVFVKMSVAKVQDFTSIGSCIYGIVIICFLALLLWTLLSRQLLKPLVCGLSAALLVALPLAGWAVVSRQRDNDNVQVIADENIRINWLPLHWVHQAVTSAWRVGYRDSDRGDWKMYGDKHATLPEHPSYALLDAKKTPVVIVLWDAARPNHMSAYGYRRQTTPYLDSVKDDFFVFTHARSGGTATSLGVRTLFTGHYSSRYMLEEQRVEPFFMHELLRSGYRQFIVDVFQSDYNGISSEAFHRHTPATYMDGANFVWVPPVECSQMVGRMIGEMDKQLDAGNPGFFMYVHAVDTHAPWRHHPGSPDWGDAEEDRYDNSIHFVDSQTARLFRHMKERGIWDDAVVIVLADHGTGMYDRGFYAGFKAYEEQIRVPLLIKLPHLKGHGQRIDLAVSHVDVAPTLENLFEAGRANRFDGISLVPLMSGDLNPADVDRPYVAAFNAFNDSLAFVEDNRWKCILRRGERYVQLFDLASDPGEKHNLSDEPAERERLDRMTGLIGRFLYHGKTTYNNPYHYSEPKPADSGTFVPQKVD